MEYIDILNKQAEKLPNTINWWPKFLYHFTDVHNAASIMNSGWIYSREKVEEKGTMKNENASRAVIEATSMTSKNKGRLYFRPLTPTQYNNEGYKPVRARKSEINASCPVPIFFCLSANVTLNYEGTAFAERGIAGKRNTIESGIEAFGRLNFDKIYHDGAYDPQINADIKEYRQSEVIRDGGFPVEPLLRCILCRSVAEKETLLYLLQNFSLRLYNTYRERIFYKPKIKCFYHNGIYIRKVTVINNKINIEFNDSNLRIKNPNQNIEFELCISLIYKKEDGSVLGMQEGKSIFSYDKINACEMLLNRKEECDSLVVRICFDDIEMYANEITTKESELL